MFFIAPCLFTACFKGAGTDTATTPNSAGDTMADPIDTGLCEDPYSVFGGHWMPQDYCDCLRAKRSAYACKELVNEVFMMSLERYGDSLRWSYVTTHEGGPEAYLHWSAAEGAFVHNASPEAGAFTGIVRVSSIDDDHLLYRAEGMNEAQHFQRVTGYDTELRNAVFAGTYFLGDTAHPVTFHGNGAIEGLTGVSRYDVLTDFTEGFDTLDIVFLHNGEYDWARDAYHYKMTAGSLRLFPMLTTAEEYVYSIGPLKYALQR